MKKILYHGSREENLKSLQVPDRNTVYFNGNSLGFGIYLTDRQNANLFATKSLYKVECILNKEISNEINNFDSEFIKKLAKEMIKEFELEELFYYVSDFLTICEVNEFKEELLVEALDSECQNSSSNKDFFDGLYIIFKSISKSFVNLGYTHTLSNKQGFEEYCVLKEAICEVREL